MEWYFGSGVDDDVVVPKNQEPLDRLPSPNSWSSWGVSKSKSLKSSNKYSIMETSSIENKPYFHGKSLNEEVDLDLAAHEAEHSSNSNVYQGYQEGSLQQDTSPWETPDNQLSDLAKTYQTDDIFMSLLLEENSTDMDNFHGSLNFIPEFKSDVLPADNLLTDMLIDSDYDPSHLFGIGSLRYLKTHAFAPSVDLGHGQVASNSRQKDNPPVKFAAACELDTINGPVNEESSLEVSDILHDFESVMAQLRKKTRICLRDALYRLAKNPKQHIVNRGQNGGLMSDKLPQLTVHVEKSRLENPKTVESETNTIDRVVANLLFGNVDLDSQKLQAAAPLNFKQEANKYSVSHSQTHV
ncbi:hypothetical protein U1Q18_015493 [Sarracenia purpurea var. burkii]